MTSDLINMAKIHLQAGRAGEAEAVLRRAVAASPRNGEAWFLLGGALAAMNRLDEAEKVFIKLAKSHAKDPAVWFNLGTVRLNAMRHEAAAKALRRAVALAPSHPMAWLNLGNALALEDRMEEAMKAYEKSLALAPHVPALHASFGSALKRTGDLERAIRHLDQAVRLAPGAVDMRLERLLTFPLIPSDETEIARCRDYLMKGLTEVEASGGTLEHPELSLRSFTFHTAYNGLDDRPLQEAVARTLLAVFPELTYTAPHCINPKPKAPGERLRVGVFSTLLRDHTVGKLTYGLLENFPKDQVELVLFQPASIAGDAVARKCAAAADRVVPTGGSLRDVRAAIAAEAVDVLFFPEVGMDAATFFLPYSRLAPVQCCTWGHPNTTGIPNMDYFISSDLLEPVGAEAHYSETLVRLSALPMSYNRAEVLPGKDIPARRSDFRLPEDKTLYVCVQSLFKAHMDFDRVLNGILEGDPDGLVVFIEGNFGLWGERLRARLEKNLTGGADRVVFVPRMDQKKFRALMAVSDVLLDTVHFCGGNTSLEAFTMGKPVVTWPSPFMRGRVTAAMYRAMGFEDLVADSLDDYVTIALRLGTDRDWRAVCGETIRQKAEVLFENDRPAHEMAAFFRKAYEEAVA